MMVSNNIYFRQKVISLAIRYSGVKGSGNYICVPIILCAPLSKIRQSESEKRRK